MIGRPTAPVGLAIVIAGDGGQVGVEFGTDGGVDERFAVLGAENQVDDDLGQ